MFRFFLLTLLLIATTHAEAAYAEYTRGESGFLRAQDSIRLYHFKAADMALCVVDEGGEAPQPYGSLERAMRAHGCTAGINGGYFGADAARTPLGLVRHEGVSVHAFSKGAFTVSGILYDTGKELRLERSTQFRRPLSQLREAIQGGPFLVEHGKLVGKLNKQRASYRTFVATDGQGNWCLGVSSPLTLHALAEWLSTPKALGEFKVEAALNLDGGGSSFFWTQKEGLVQSGFRLVRNYVGVRPRQGKHSQRP